MTNSVACVGKNCKRALWAWINGEQICHKHMKIYYAIKKDLLAAARSKALIEIKSTEIKNRNRWDNQGQPGEKP
jgi:hypothetical protein